MAGCSAPADSSLDILEILRKLQSLGFCLDLDTSVKGPGEVSKEELGLLFNRILSLFLKEIHLQREIRPLPAMLGDGRSVDSFELYRVVREKGGYELVSGSQSWASVAEEIGLDSGFGSSLKLIYVKYLVPLDRWLRRVLDEKEAGDRAGGKADLGTLVGELEMEISSRFCETPNHQKKDSESTTPSGSKRDQFLTPVRANGRNLQLDDGGSRKDDDVAEMLERNAGNGDFSSLKRKREAMVGMLNWVKMVAKNPNDQSIGKLLADGATSKAHAIGELFSQALLARRAMFLKIIRKDSDEPLLQLQEGKQAYTSIYVDCVGVGTQTNEKNICNEGLESVNNHSDSAVCLKTSTLPGYNSNKGLMVEEQEVNGAKRGLNSRDQQQQQQQQQTPLGPSFQAEVPDWSGKPSEASCESDNLKWLGIRIWPPESQEIKQPYEQDCIGKGREENCQCERPVSVECVRFHVAEKRLRLKRELGSVFHSWRFNHMGEEVALSWTEEEERKFKAIVRLNPPSQLKSLWHQLCASFPLKGRQNLVSYYFNVFLLARRSYQNRVTPNRIDSDDEESEFGFLSNPFGHDAVRVCDPMPIFCVQNAQCVDLD